MPRADDSRTSWRFKRNDNANSSDQPDDYEKLGAINRQLAELPKAVKHTACANSDGLKTQDRRHFNSPSLQELRRRYAQEMQKLLSKPDKAKAARQ